MTTDIRITDSQLAILQHALGCDTFGQTSYVGHDEGDGCSIYYRNRYVSTPTPDIDSLVNAGMMQDLGVWSISRTNAYRVTERGMQVMRDRSPKPPKLTRAQKRYRAFLGWSDAYGGTFREFLSWLKFNNTSPRSEQ